MSSLAAVSLACLLVAPMACSKALPDEGTLTSTSDKVSATGAYTRVAIDSVERLSIEDGKLVLHGASGRVAVDLPPNADPGQKNRGWALVTEGEDEGARTLTFTQETSLEDFSVRVPKADGQIAYGSLGGRNGHDILVFAYGTASKAYWAWVEIAGKGQAAR